MSILRLSIRAHENPLIHLICTYTHTHKVSFWRSLNSRWVIRISFHWNICFNIWIHTRDGFKGMLENFFLHWIWRVTTKRQAKWWIFWANCHSDAFSFARILVRFVLAELMLQNTSQSITITHSLAQIPIYLFALWLCTHHCSTARDDFI